MVWRTGILLTCIAGAAVLAYQIGSRLSDEAVMTIAGVSCGILAGIPVSIGLLIALTRERATSPQNDYDADRGLAPDPYNVYRAPAPQSQLPPQLPQIIVVAPPQSGLNQNPFPYQNYLPPQSVPLLPASAPMQERTFKIVGEEEGD